MTTYNDSVSPTSDDMEIIVPNINDTKILTTDESTADNIQITSDDNSKVKMQVTVEDPVSPIDSSATSNIYSQREGTLQRLNIANNLANGTMTIVKQRFKPLILKLRNPQYSLFELGNAIMSQDDIESMIDELGNDLVAYIIDAVNTIRDETKRARPRQGDENYELKMVAYQELLANVTRIINTVTKVIDHSLTEYRRLIDLLWCDIQRYEYENDVQHCVEHFRHQSEIMFHDEIMNNI